MTSTVKIALNPKNGQIFTANDNLGKDGKVYGFLRLEQQIVDFHSSVANVKVISALKSISLEAYEKAKTFLTEGMEIGGKIIITESLKEDVGFKIKYSNGENTPICMFNGKPIYRKTEYSDAEDQTHTLISHTNGEEIKAYNAMKVSAKALN